MENRLVIALVIVSLTVVGVGFIFLNPNSTPGEEQELPTYSPSFPFGNRTGMPRMGNRTNIFSELIQKVNSSETLGEIQEYITNMTENMNQDFNMTNIPQGDLVNPFTELFTTLEEDIQGYITNETPIQEAKEQIIQKIEEAIESFVPITPP